MVVTGCQIQIYMKYEQTKTVGAGVVVVKIGPSRTHPSKPPVKQGRSIYQDWRPSDL